MSSIVPANKRILPIWSNVWMLFFLLATALVITPCVISQTWDDTSSWRIRGWNTIYKTAGNYALVLGLFIFFSIFFWDLILYWLRSGRPLRKLFKSGILPGNIPELKSTRRTNKAVCLVSFICFLFVLVLILCVLMHKETNFFSEKVKKYFSWASYDSNKKYYVWGATGAVFLFGLLSFWLKHKLTEKWDVCMWSYPQKQMGTFIRPKAGVTCLWINHLNFWLITITAGLALVTGVFAAGKYDWLKEVGYKYVASQINTKAFLWQTFAIAVFLSGLLLLVSHLGKKWKSVHDLNTTIRSHELFTRDAYSYAIIKRSLGLVTFWQTACVVAWFLTIPTIILMNQRVYSNNITEIPYVAAFTSGCLFLFSVCLFIVQHNARIKFEKCKQGAVIKKSSRILDPLEIRDSII